MAKPQTSPRPRLIASKSSQSLKSLFERAALDALIRTSHRDARDRRERDLKEGRGRSGRPLAASNSDN